MSWHGLNANSILLEPIENCRCVILNRSKCYKGLGQILMSLTYKPILDNPFEISSPNSILETPIVLSFLSAQKKYVGVILDEQVVFTRDYEGWWFLVCWVGWPNSNDTWITKDTLQQIIMIYNNTIRAT